MLYVVIPAYNEEGNLGALVADITAVAVRNDLACTIIIIDDGSTDRTPAIIKELSDRYGVVALENRPNAGLGKTMAKGLAKALELAAAGDIVVTLDGDGTHDPVYIPEMIKLLAEGYDIVIASRFAPGGAERGLPFFRRLLSRGSGLLLGIFFPTPGVSDYTSGFRAFKAEIIERGYARFGDDFIRETGFTVTPEILLKLRSIGARIGEVGFTLRYDRKIGKSKVKIPQTIAQYIKMIAALRIRGL